MRSIRPRSRSLFPSFKERSWGDSSFHSAAIRGQPSTSANLLARKSASARALLQPEVHQSGTVRPETTQRSTIAFRNLCAARAIRSDISLPVGKSTKVFFSSEAAILASQSWTQVPVATFHWFRSGSWFSTPRYFFNQMSAGVLTTFPFGRAQRDLAVDWFAQRKFVFAKRNLRLSSGFVS